MRISEAKLKVNDDGQFVIVISDPFGSNETVVSRKDSCALAEKLLLAQGHLVTKRP